MKINRISPQSNKYLQIITTIASCPEKLYFIGKLPDTRTPSVAIVGARKHTSYGKEVTYKIAYDLAKKGIIIISGMALGIDGIAHQAAIDAGGQTIAVLPCSVENIYPAAHHSLSRAILAQNGVIISEYEPGVLARDYQFLERNRIVSGLADAVIVTEAAIRSGTLSTVAHALNQGKEVFVVPGNITSPMSAGCNQLIKQGAHPITCAEDVISVIAPNLLTKQNKLPLGDNPLQSKIIKLLQNGLRDGDEILQQTNVAASNLSIELTMLEISGIIRSLGGNQWTLR